MLQKTIYYTINIRYDMRDDEYFNSGLYSKGRKVIVFNFFENQKPMKDKIN